MRTLSIQEQRDLERFNYGKALCGISRIGGERLDGIERELHQEGQREAQEAHIPAGGGIILPRFFVRRADRSAIRETRTLTATGLTSAPGDQGGMTVGNFPTGLMDSFYNASFLERAGFTIIEGAVGNLSFPRYLKDSDPAEKPENTTATASSPTTGTITLTPHRTPATVLVSNQLLIQSSVDIAEKIFGFGMRQLRSIAQNGIVSGTGSSNQPTGILNTAGVTQLYAGGANANSAAFPSGASQVFPDWAYLEAALGLNNVDGATLGYLTNSKVRNQAKQTKRGKTTPTDTSVTDSNMIWHGPANLVNCYPAFTSNSVPSNLSKGGSAGTLSALIHGLFEDGIFVTWGGLGLELIQGDSTLAPQGLSMIVMTLWHDFGIVRPVSFAAIQDIAA